MRAQTDQEFDLWISLDGLRPEDVQAAVGGAVEAQWSVAEAGASPAALRSAMLGRLAELYDGVVLVDSDDVLEPSRVAAARVGLTSADVVGCALRISDAAGRLLGPVLGVEEPHAPWDVLLARHNVFGLSNTAYRGDVLRACLPVPRDAVLTDWLLITRALAHGATLRFDAVPRMVYRQHPGNVARVLPPFDAEYVARATDLVLGHYAQVLDHDDGVPAERQSRLREARREVQAFHRAIAGSPARLQRYVEALNGVDPQYVWWWCVANPQLEDVWRN